MPEIPVLLKTEPEVGTYASDSRQTKSCVWGNATLPADDLVQTWKGDAELNCKG